MEGAGPKTAGTGYQPPPPDPPPPPTDAPPPPFPGELAAVLAMSSAEADPEAATIRHDSDDRPASKPIGSSTDGAGPACAMTAGGPLPSLRTPAPPAAHQPDNAIGRALRRSRKIGPAAPAAEVRSSASGMPVLMVTPSMSESSADRDAKQLQQRPGLTERQRLRDSSLKDERETGRAVRTADSTLGASPATPSKPGRSKSGRSKSFMRRFSGSSKRTKEQQSPAPTLTTQQQLVRGLAMRSSLDPSRGWWRGRGLSPHCSVYRFLAAGVKPKTTVRERCDGARGVRRNPSYPLPLGHCWDGQTHLAP